jgi:hypothetical protein
MATTVDVDAAAASAPPETADPAFEILKKLEPYTVTEKLAAVETIVEKGVHDQYEVASALQKNRKAEEGVISLVDEDSFDKFADSPEFMKGMQNGLQRSLFTEEKLKGLSNANANDRAFGKLGYLVAKEQKIQSELLTRDVSKKLRGLPKVQTGLPSSSWLADFREMQRKKATEAAEARKRKQIQLSVSAVLAQQQEGPVRQNKITPSSIKRKKSTRLPTEGPEREKVAALVHAVNVASGGKNDRAAYLAAAILRGVSMRPSGKWQAQMYFAGKSRYIGVFDTREKAALAYEIARKKLKFGPQGSTRKSTENLVNAARKAALEGVTERIK